MEPYPVIIYEQLFLIIKLYISYNSARIDCALDHFKALKLHLVSWLSKDIGINYKFEILATLMYPSLPRLSGGGDTALRNPSYLGQLLHSNLRPTLTGHPAPPPSPRNLKSKNILSTDILTYSFAILTYSTVFPSITRFTDAFVRIDFINTRNAVLTWS